MPDTDDAFAVKDAPFGVYVLENTLKILEKGNLHWF